MQKLLVTEPSSGNPPLLEIPAALYIYTKNIGIFELSLTKLQNLAHKCALFHRELTVCQ